MTKCRAETEIASAGKYSLSNFLILSPYGCVWSNILTWSDKLTCIAFTFVWKITQLMNFIENVCRKGAVVITNRSQFFIIINNPNNFGDY